MDAHWRSWPEKDCFALEVGRDDTNETDAGPYKRLSREKNEIRLVEVLPGSSSDPIRCRVASFPLDDTPTYTALSYAWGEPDRDGEIDLNGYPLVTRRNLWRFMHQIRKLTAWRGTKFWIDAICINQSDKKERSQQVALMAKIYGLASQVLVWLGPGHHNGEVALRFLGGVRKNGLRMSKTWLRRTASGLRLLCERRYWTRLWVVQELVLAQDICVLCGAEHLAWQTLLDALTVLEAQLPECSQDTYAGIRAIMRTSAASMISRFKQVKTKDSLYDQLLASARLGCSDPRDKVFALLGIVGSGHEHIVPDYNMEISDILNTVLRNHHRLHTPKSLIDIRNQCHRITDAVGVDLASIFALKQAHAAVPLPAIYIDPGSGLSFAWAASQNHEHVQRLWISKHLKEGLHWVQFFAARHGQEGLCRLILQNAQLRRNRVAISGFQFEEKYRNPPVETCSGDSLPIAELLLWLYVRSPNAPLFREVFTLCLKNGHTAAALALLGNQLAAAPIDVEALFALVQAAMSQNDALWIQSAFQATQYCSSITIDIDCITHVLIRDMSGKDPSLFSALLEGFRLIRHGTSGFNDTKSELVLENDYRCLLMRSFKSGLARAARQLIERPEVGANSLYQRVDDLSPFYASPLCIAISYYNVPIVETLLSRENLKLDTTFIPMPVCNTIPPSFPEDWKKAQDCVETTRPEHQLTRGLQAPNAYRYDPN